GDISHHANRKREIKFRSVRFRRMPGRRSKFCQPIIPPGTVIVLCGKPLLVGLEQHSDHLSRLWGWLHAVDPPQRITVEFVEFLHMLAVIAEIRPAQVGEAAAANGCGQPGLTFGAQRWRPRTIGSGCCKLSLSRAC